jgi:hypothetical protein
MGRRWNKTQCLGNNSPVLLRSNIL